MAEIGPSLRYIVRRRYSYGGPMPKEFGILRTVTVTPGYREVRLGFIINMKKSALKPERVRSYLGMVIPVDTLRGRLTASDDRRDKVINLIQQLIANKNRCSAVHDVEIVTGSLISMH